MLFTSLEFFIFLPYSCGRALASSKRASLRAAGLTGGLLMCSDGSPPSNFMISSPAKSRARI